MAKLPKRRELQSQWPIAARLLLDGADAGELTTAIELALLFEARLDVTLAPRG